MTVFTDARALIWVGRNREYSIACNSLANKLAQLQIEIQNTKDETSSFYQNKGYNNLVNTMLELFVAGSETTSTTLTWAVLYMIREPEIQSRVQAELDKVVGTSRLPSLSPN